MNTINLFTETAKICIHKVDNFPFHKVSDINALFSTCYIFGLATAPFLFNLFTEALHWVLERRLHLIITFFALIHYLNNFIFILHPGTSYTPVVRVYNFTT